MIRLSLAARNAMLDAVAARIDAGGIDRPGTIALYSAASPASPDERIAGEPLVVLRFSFPAFGSTQDGEVESGEIEGIATAAGTASWARISDGLGKPVLDGDVGARGRPGAAAFVSLTPSEIVVGGPVILESVKLRLSE